MRSVLQSEVAKIPAKISNPEVLQPQGNHDAWPEDGQLPVLVERECLRAQDIPARNEGNDAIIDERHVWRPWSIARSNYWRQVTVQFWHGQGFHVLWCV